MMDMAGQGQGLRHLARKHVQQEKQVAAPQNEKTHNLNLIQKPMEFTRKPISEMLRSPLSSHLSPY